MFESENENSKYVLDQKLKKSWRFCINHSLTISFVMAVFLVISANILADVFREIISRIALPVEKDNWTNLLQIISLILTLTAMFFSPFTNTILVFVMKIRKKKVVHFRYNGRLDWLHYIDAFPSS